MRKFILLILLFPYVLIGQSAKNKIKVILKSPTTSIAQYNVDFDYDYIELPSQYADDSIKIVNLKGKKIIKVDLVYTKYHLSKDYNQLKLNYLRFRNFFKSYPKLVSNNLIKWNVVEQTGCNSQYTCRKFFHGFVIYFAKRPTKESLSVERTSLSSYMKKVEAILDTASNFQSIETTELTCKYPRPKSKFSFFQQKWKKTFKGKVKSKTPVLFTALVNTKGTIDSLILNQDLGKKQDRFIKTFKKLYKFKPAIVADTKVPARVSGKMQLSLKSKKGNITIEGYQIDTSGMDLDSIIFSNKTCKCYQIDTSYSKALSYVSSIGEYTAKDKDVFVKVMERNSDWKNLMVAVDVTGSMSPYTADVLIWLKLSAKHNIKRFIFFNDGDLKPDDEKVIGSTGGLYAVESTSYEAVRDTMFKAMSSGWGGDLEENNFEAILQGQKDCKECKDFVMIADNYAFPRDVELIKKYKGQVKIILCGVRGSINTRYLELAKKYKLSIHTLNDDLNELYKLREGDTFKVEGIEYKIVRGRITEQ